MEQRKRSFAGTDAQGNMKGFALFPNPESLANGGEGVMKPVVAVAEM